MSTGDSTYIKALNRRILIEKIIKHRSISRSELARMTGLNKSTVSAQVQQMMKEDLIIEKRSDVSSGGRKPILLEISRESGYAIGVDIDENLIQIQVTNLLGSSIYTQRVNHKSDNPEDIIRLVTSEITNVISIFDNKYTPIGLIGIGIGIHGIVANNDKIIYTPKMRLAKLPIKFDLESKFNVPVFIDNNSNLCAYAEQVYTSSISDLFCITMYSGIGLGIIHNSKIYRGFHGFAGEIGHMTIERNGRSCTCGNKGCWELYASEKALLKELKAQGLDLNEIEDVKVDDIFNSYPKLIEEFLDNVTIGLNNIINIFNPETVILNGHILNNNEYLIDQVKQRLTSRMNNYDRIISSELGKSACSLGGAMVALKNYFGVQNLDFTAYNYYSDKQPIK
ncbi:ROK family protein [Pseudalkalibacillus sp. A8]|uniref:ROK family protein n=1 Tax=Pseudalkalibacillus sp. A8 TaxID=3382641 RepID=UPI0038B4CBA5